MLSLQEHMGQKDEFGLRWRGDLVDYREDGYEGPLAADVVRALDVLWIEHFRKTMSVTTKAFAKVLHEELLALMLAAVGEYPEYRRKQPVIVGASIFDRYYLIGVRGYADLDLRVEHHTRETYMALIQGLSVPAVNDLTIICDILANITDTCALVHKMNARIQAMRIEWQRPFLPRAGFYSGQGRTRKLRVG